MLKMLNDLQVKLRLWDQKISSDAHTKTSCLYPLISPLLSYVSFGFLSAFSSFSHTFPINLLKVVSLKARGSLYWY